MTGPIESVIQDGSDVSKSGLRGHHNARVIHIFADADAVRAADLANIIQILVSPRLYIKDTGDTTSADDGTTLIRDINGIAFKHVAVGIAITSFEGAYSGAATYGQGALVSLSGSLFASRIDGNLNNAPDSATPGDTTQWMLIPTIAGPGVTGTSTTSLLIGTGARVFTTQEGIGWVVGSRVRAASAANTANYMEGRVTAYSGALVTVTIDQTGGSGTLADWNIGIAGDVGPAGADLGIPFNFDNGTADVDPGAGEWGVNDADLSLATEIRLSETDANGANIAAELAAWDDSSSTTAKGILEIRKRDDEATFVRYTVTSTITDAGAYDTFTIVHRASAGSFSVGDRCQVLFSEKGDIGTGDLDSANNLSDVASAATSFDNIKQAASTTATGVVELATQVEADAEADATRAVTPARLSKLARKDVENQTITGGAAVTSKDLGTQTTGTLTLDMGDRAMQHYINGGAHTLAPGAVNGACLLDITNNGSAGAITTSGWTKVSGDSFDTVDANVFRCHCSVANGGSLLVVQAMQ